MFKKLELLTEQRAQKKDALEGLLKKQSVTDYETTEDEVHLAFGLDKDLDDLETEIKFLQKQKQRFLDSAGDQMTTAPTIMRDTAPRQGEAGNIRDLQKSYSISKAILHLTGKNKKLDGAEAEAHQMAEEEAKKNGVDIYGVGLPSVLVKVTTGAESGNEGSDFVPLDLFRTPITALTPTLLAEELGATVFRGLTGNLDVPRITNTLTSAWEGQFDDNANTQTATDKLHITPHRMGSYTDLGKQWLFQGITGDQYIIDELRRSQKELLDSDFWNGGDGGVADPLTGILSLTNVGVVSIGANGGAPLRDHLINLEKEVAIDNADVGDMAYVTTPGVRAKLKLTKTDAGSGLFVWDGNFLNGYRAFVTTQIPSNLTKGSGTSLHAIVFGVFSTAIIAQFGGYDIVLDDATQALKATLRVVVNSWWDTAFRHDEAFAVVKDADIT